MYHITNQLRKAGVLLSISCSSFFSAAQDSEFVKPGFSYGGRLGLAILSLGNSQPYTGERAGFYIGGVLEYAPNAWLSILAKPGYAQYGGRTGDFTNEALFFQESVDPGPIFEELPTPEEIPAFDHRLYATNSTISVHSIELPVVARYGRDLENLRLFAGAGVSVNYQVWVSEFLERTYFLNPFFISTAGTDNATQNYEPFHLGGLVEIGTIFRSGEETRLVLNLSYQRGLTPLRRSFSYLNLSEVSSHLYADRFSLGLAFMF